MSLTRTIALHSLTAVITCTVTWLYMNLSDPPFFRQLLVLREVKVLSFSTKQIYNTVEMKKARFAIDATDKCYYISNEDYSFGIPDSEWMGYEKMIVICPGKGIGWATNSW